MTDRSITRETIPDDAEPDEGAFETVREALDDLLDHCLAQGDFMGEIISVCAGPPRCTRVDGGNGACPLCLVGKVSELVSPEARDEFVAKIGRAN